MTEFKEIEDRCIEHLDLDYVPLNDIVREFSGFDNPPAEDEFLNALEFLEYLIDKHKIKSLEGPSMKEIKMSTKELIDWLKQKWYSGQYDQLNYGIWFEKQ